MTPTIPYDADNIFTKIITGELPSHKVYENDHVYAFMDIMPQCDGHTLVIPKIGARNLLDIEPQNLSNLIIGTQHVAKAVKQAMNADGISLQQFSEPAGGQVVFHIHFHILPRFDGQALKPHTGQVEDNDKLAAIAEKIREYV